MNQEDKKAVIDLKQKVEKEDHRAKWGLNGRSPIGLCSKVETLKKWGDWRVSTMCEAGEQGRLFIALGYEMKEKTTLGDCLKGLKLYYFLKQKEEEKGKSCSEFNDGVTPSGLPKFNWNLKLFIEYHKDIKRENWTNYDEEEIVKWIINQKNELLKRIESLSNEIHALETMELSNDVKRDTAKWYQANKGENIEGLTDEQLLNIYKTEVQETSEDTLASKLRNSTKSETNNKNMSKYNELWYFTLNKIQKEDLTEEIDGMINVCGAEYNENQLFCHPCKKKDKYFCDHLKWIRAGIATFFAKTHDIEDIKTFFAGKEKKNSEEFKINEDKIIIDTNASASTVISEAINAFDNFTEQKEQFKIIFKYGSRNTDSKRKYMEKFIGKDNILPYSGKLERNEKNEDPKKQEDNTLAHNRIVFGAPGTGKSHEANLDANKLLLGNHKEERDLTKEEKETKAARMERVTFHPEYSYFDFVGSYKPVMRNVPAIYVEGGISKTAKTEQGEKATERKIEYAFVPGPFTRILVKALKDDKHPYLLLIEEINRARVAAVFGDVFQLLDRTKGGESEYSICLSEDLREYLKEQDMPLNELKLPSNLYIWATMNSADQGVYPLDTAFKRRWSMEYLSINEGAENDSIGWNTIRKGINDLLKPHVNEDKLMGYYFLKEEERDTEEHLKEALAGKVLMYLFDDAAKPCRKAVFKEINKARIYSDLREKMSLSESNLGIFTGSEFWPGQQEQRAGGNVQNETHTEEAETDVEQQ